METPTKSLANLNLTAGNPRVLTHDQSDTMDKQLEKFGPLDGIVYNVNPAIMELVGGNQRTLKFRADVSVEIVIEMEYLTPTKSGTVAEGYIRINGERWNYREVNWTKSKHKAGVLAANNAGGANDLDALAEYAFDIDEDWQALTSMDLTNLQPDPFDDIEDAVTKDKPKGRKWSTDELREFAKSYYPDQLQTITGFLAVVDDRA